MFKITIQYTLNTPQGPFQKIEEHEVPLVVATQIARENISGNNQTSPELTADLYACLGDRCKRLSKDCLITAGVLSLWLGPEKTPLFKYSCTLL